jgi:hypothetical protein
MHSIQFPAKAAFRHEHFHDVWISSLGGFRSRGTFVGMARSHKCVMHLEILDRFRLVIWREIWQFSPVEKTANMLSNEHTDHIPAQRTATTGGTGNDPAVNFSSCLG